MIRIMGIDPGSKITGFGVIDSDGRRNFYVASGCIRIKQSSLPDRLRVIFEGIQTLITAHKPEQIAIENIFMHRNADSALKLGQARGAAICAVVTRSVPVFEYTPAQIKQSVVGKGNAAKQQIQHMVKVLMNLSGEPQADAADALATALCHANYQAGVEKIIGATV